MPSAAPIRPASPVSTQQGVETSLRNDLTPFRKACITELDTRYTMQGITSTHSVPANSSRFPPDPTTAPYKCRFFTPHAQPQQPKKQTLKNGSMKGMATSWEPLLILVA